MAIRKRWAGLLCPSSFLPGASCWRNDGFNNFQLDVMSFLLFPAVQHNGMHWVLRWDETARTEECFSSACLSLFLTSSDRMFQMEILSTQKTFLLIFEWSTLTPFYFIIFWSQRKAFFSLFFNCLIFAQFQVNFLYVLHFEHPFNELLNIVVLILLVSLYILVFLSE